MDWDFDGHLDILSGCYWTKGEDGAHLQILKGNGDMDFEKAQAVTNVAGDPLQNIEIEGQGDRNQTLAICTEQHAVDYDGDGDLDIVMGCFSSNLFLYENITKEPNKNEISEEVTQIKISGQAPGFYHSAPHLVDWDGDGDLDLLTGSGSGGALISINEGTRQEPEWSNYKQLVDPSSLHEQFEDDEIKMGPSTRIWATDFNKDGLLDLLVGDSTTIISPKDGLTREQWQEKRDAHQKEMRELSSGQREMNIEYGEYIKNGEEVPDELQEKMDAFSKKYRELYSAQNDFQTQTRTGHVWVLIQKGPKQVDAPKGTDVSQVNH